MQELLTLPEVCEILRVGKRTLIRYGLRRLGGVQLGPKTWRFRREVIENYGLQKHEHEQGEVALDGAADKRREETAESFSHQKGGPIMGDAGRKIRTTCDPFGLLD